MTQPPLDAIVVGLHKNTNAPPWSLAAIAPVLAIVLAVLLRQQLSAPASAVRAGTEADFKIRFEPATAGHPGDHHCSDHENRLATCPRLGRQGQ